MMRAGTGRAFFLCFSNSLARRFGRASLVLLLLAPQVAQAQKILDFVCEFATVTVGSQPSEDGDIRPGDWMILSAEAPVDRPPTNGSPIPGGAAVYWDLERQNECSHVPPNGAVTSGVADLSRAIVEDAAFDAVGWDSIGSFFTLGASEVTRCGMGLRDDDGQSFDVVNFPDPLTLEGWTTNVCYFEGASGGQTVTALGPAELIVDRSQIGDLVTLDVPYGDTKALIAAVIWANENQSQDRFQFTRIRFTGAQQEFVFDAPFGGSDHALPVITSSIEFRDSGTFRFGVQSLRSYRFAKLEGDGWLIVRDATIAAFQGPGGGGAILLTGQSQFAGNGQFSDNFSDGDGGFALVQGEAGISLIDSDVSGNETEGNGGAIALAGQASASIFDGVSGETTFQGNMAAGSGGALFRGESSQLHVEGVAFQANQAESQGGAISVHGESIEVVLEAATRVSTSRFSGNQSNGVGCDVHIDVEGSSGQRADIFMQANIFDDSCPGAALAHDEGAAFFLGNTFSDSGGGTVVVSSPGASEWYRNIISARLALPMTLAWPTNSSCWTS